MWGLPLLIQCPWKASVLSQHKMTIYCWTNFIGTLLEVDVQLEEKLNAVFQALPGQSEHIRTGKWSAVSVQGSTSRSPAVLSHDCFSCKEQNAPQMSVTWRAFSIDLNVEAKVYLLC